MNTNFNKILNDLHALSTKIVSIVWGMVIRNKGSFYMTQIHSSHYNTVHTGTTEITFPFSKDSRLVRKLSNTVPTRDINIMKVLVIKYLGLGHYQTLCHSNCPASVSTGHLTHRVTHKSSLSQHSIVSVRTRSLRACNEIKPTTLATSTTYDLSEINNDTTKVNM